MLNMGNFPVDTKVSFDYGSDSCPLKGTGVILGFAYDYIIKLYIVGLDESIEGQKALLIPSTAMKVIEEDEDEKELFFVEDDKDDFVS